MSPFTVAREDDLGRRHGAIQLGVVGLKQPCSVKKTQVTRHGAANWFRVFKLDSRNFKHKANPGRAQ